MYLFVALIVLLPVVYHLSQWLGKSIDSLFNTTDHAKHYFSPRMYNVDIVMFS